VLGIMPLANGFDQVLIAPHPGDLAWAKGGVPTPHGIVEVAWEWRETIFHLTVTLPKATAFQVHLPFNAKHVEVEGHTSWSAGQSGHKSAHLSLLTDSSGPVTLVAEEGGSYSILAQG
jgi:alpha-L-rhamnosidase